MNQELDDEQQDYSRPSCAPPARQVSLPGLHHRHGLDWGTVVVFWLLFSAGACFCVGFVTITLHAWSILASLWHR